jgi:predicted GH43/DUF377 family glycosyl hydrolase
MRSTGRPRWFLASLCVVVLVVAAGIAVVKIHGSGWLSAGKKSPAGAASTTPASGASQVSSASQVDLPDWAIGPFTRYAGNPILTPPVNPGASQFWEWPEIFNPGVVVVNGVFHMLYRGTNVSNVSAIGAAVSKDGYHFTPIARHPVIGHTLPSENQGVEDPRLYYLAGKYYSFFTGDSGAYPGAKIDINEAVSANGRTWTQLGPVLDNSKDAAVVASPQGQPVKIGGHYLMYYGQFGQVYLAKSTDFVHWSTTGAVNLHFPANYGGYEFCVAVTNYQTTATGGTNSDIDLFVAGQLMGQGRWYYAISQVEFTRGRLRSAAARLDVASLAPQEPYEIYGHTPQTVFMNNIIFYQGQWWMYYGAGDSVVALAQAKLR